MTRTVLPSLALNTDSLPEPDRFAAWAATVPSCVAERLDVEGPFHAEANAWLIGGIVLSRSTIPAVKLVRSAERMGLDGMDYWLLVLNTRGTWCCRTNGAQLSFAEDAICLLDSTTPFEITTPGGDFIIMSVARQVLDLGDAQRGLHAHRLAHAAGQLFGDYLKALCRNLSGLPASEAPLVERATRDLLVACLSTAEAPSLPSDARSDVLLRVRRHIDERLGDELSPIGVARALGISRTRLYSIFSPAGGVRTFILRRRLLHARRALEDPLDRRTIATVGYAHGFSSSAHFSRVFRQFFGASPNAVRARGRALCEAAPSVAAHDVVRTLSLWKRQSLGAGA